MLCSIVTGVLVLGWVQVVIVKFTCFESYIYIYIYKFASTDMITSIRIAWYG